MWRPWGVRVRVRSKGLGGMLLLGEEWAACSGSSGAGQTKLSGSRRRSQRAGEQPGRLGGPGCRCVRGRCSPLLPEEASGEGEASWLLLAPSPELQSAHSHWMDLRSQE